MSLNVYKCTGVFKKRMLEVIKKATRSKLSKQFQLPKHRFK